MTEKKAEESGGFMSDLTRKDLKQIPNRTQRRGRRVVREPVSLPVTKPSATHAEDLARANAEESVRPSMQLAPHGWM
jgi:hypothetical protein